MAMLTQQVAEEFVRAWQESNSIDQVEKRLKISKQIIDYRRKKLIKLGVSLKQFPRRKPKQKTLDITRLNILADIAANNKCPE